MYRGMPLVLAMSMLLAASTAAQAPLESRARGVDRQTYLSSWRAGIRAVRAGDMADIAAVAEGRSYSAPADTFELRRALMNGGEWPSNSGTPPDNLFILNPIANEFPYALAITTPFSRGVALLREAKRKYLPIPNLSSDTLNAEGVVIVVSPSANFLKAESIERVVLKRGADIVMPSSAAIVPATISNAAGASRTVNGGAFSFPIDAFAPTEHVSVVLIGPARNQEWTLNRRELEALR